MMQYEVTKYPEELKKKVTLLNHFHSYLIVESQKKNIENKFKFSENTQQTSPLVYLKKWMKTKHAILFRLSNKIVQV